MGVEAGRELYARMVAHRHHLHQHPEVGLSLPDTHDYIIKALKNLGLDPESTPGTGVSVRIRGTNPNTLPIIFRADMDALPIEEDITSSFQSRRPGAMHACGHDLHMATLLGVAEDLIARPAHKDVILAFQPGEESDRGALQTLTHRNLDVAEAETFAVHVNAVMPPGTVAYSRNVFMAYGDWFEATFEGAGGHASAPERVGNPIRAAAVVEERLVALAKELSRANARIVATTTEVIAGNTVNVIPTTARMRGTFRAVTSDQREQLHQGARELVEQVADQFRLAGSLTITHGYPAVECDSAFVDHALSTWKNASIPATFGELEHPSMVIEDFSYFLHKWPGAMVYVGAAVGTEPSFNHSATAQFDDKAMATSFALFRALAPSA